MFIMRVTTKHRSSAGCVTFTFLEICLYTKGKNAEYVLTFSNVSLPKSNVMNYVQNDHYHTTPTQPNVRNLMHNACYKKTQIHLNYGSVIFAVLCVCPFTDTKCVD